MAHAQGHTGRRTVVEVVVPPRHDPDLLIGLRADLDRRWADARYAYARSLRMGRCRPGSRCSWHDRLDAELLRERECFFIYTGYNDFYTAYAITCANKLISLRLDTGLAPSTLFRTAEKHYLLALDLAPPSARSHVLLGFAALYGEAGQEDRARRLFREVRLEESESATSFGNLAYFLTTVGDNERAFAMLERALSLDDPDRRYRTWVLESDDYHRVRNDPRFEEILARY